MTPGAMSKQLFVGAEHHGCGSNQWALELDLDNAICRWAYHSKWMGNYDKSILTDGVLTGAIAAGVAVSTYELVFNVPCLTTDEYCELHENTYIVSDQERRRRAFEKAMTQLEYMDVRMTLDTARAGYYYEEATPDGLFPEQESFMSNMGEFLERTASRFTAVLVNRDIDAEIVEHVEDNEVYTEVSFCYKNGRCVLPYGFGRKHLPLFDVDGELLFENIPDESRPDYVKKASYRKMALANIACSLLEQPPRYTDSQLGQARALFDYDTRAEENIARLRNRGVEVAHGVDATRLGEKNQ